MAVKVALAMQSEALILRAMRIQGNAIASQELLVQRVTRASRDTMASRSMDVNVSQLKFIFSPQSKTLLNYSRARVLITMFSLTI